MPCVVKQLCLVVLVACAADEPKAPEAELRALLYCNQDWGSSPHRINNDGNPRCETPCASFSMLEHHGGCTLVAPTEVSGTTCEGALTVKWEGWKGCCAPHTKDALGNFEGVRFVECN